MKMDKRNQGLTVGELTIAIAAIILIFFVWSGINKSNNDRSRQISIISNNFAILKAN